jgi:hypothetical protein
MTHLMSIINHHGHPLMPCKLSNARMLARDGRIWGKQRSPFPIQWLRECEEHIQKVVVGIDKGRWLTGFACGGKGEILLSGEMIHLQLNEHLRLTCLSDIVGEQTPAGSQTAHLEFPQEHDRDACRVATAETGDVVPWHTRRQSHDLPRQGQGQVRSHVNEEHEGSGRGDGVRVKGTSVKQVTSISCIRYLAFPCGKGEPPFARPKDCVLRKRGTATPWQTMAGDSPWFQ